jgi:hypothetical protein
MLAFTDESLARLMGYLAKTSYKKRGLVLRDFAKKAEALVDANLDQRVDHDHDQRVDHDLDQLNHPNLDQVEGHVGR